MSLIEDLTRFRKAQIKKSMRVWQGDPAARNENCSYSILPDRLLEVVMEMANDTAGQGQLEFQVIFGDHIGFGQLHVLKEQLTSAKYGVKFWANHFGPPAYATNGMTWERDTVQGFSNRKMSIRIK
jgi:hypothetical protein